MEGDKDIPQSKVTGEEKKPSMSTPAIDLDAFLLKIGEKLDQTKKEIQENMSGEIKSNQENMQKALDQTQKSTQENMQKALDMTQKEMLKEIKLLKEETRQERTEILEIIRTEIEQVNVRVELIQEKVQTEINNLKINMSGEIENKIKPIQDIMSGEMFNMVHPIQEKLEKFDKDLKEFKANKVQEKIQVVVSPTMFKNDGDLKFGGDSRFINPKKFIKALREQLDTVSDLDQLKKMLRSTLKGDAETWFDIHEENFENFAEFEIIFLSYYWGEQTQSKIREGLFFGKYENNFGTPREKYAMRKYVVAKQLDPPIANSDIIKYISRHFDDDIRNVIAINDIRSIDRLLEYLRRIDDIKRPKNRRDGGRASQSNNDCEVRQNRKEEGCTENNVNSERSTARPSDNYQNNRKFNERRYEHNNGRNYYRENNYPRNGNQNREETRNTQDYGKRQYSNWKNENEIQKSREQNNNKGTGPGNSHFDPRNCQVNTMVQGKETLIVHAIADENQDF